MSRSRTVKRSRSSSKKKKATFSFLPVSIQAFIARRLVDVYAGLMAISGVFILLSLISYSHQDPSWNTASTNEQTTNWMGTSGAWISDVLLQSFGIGSFVLGIGMCLWAFRAYKRHRLSPFSLRIAALLISTIASSIALAQIPASGASIHPYLGSSAGTLLLEWLNSILPYLGSITIPLIAGSITITSFLYAVGTTRYEIAFAALAAKSTIIGSSVFIYSLIRAFSGWISHYNDPNYKPAPIKMPSLKIDKPKIKPTSASKFEDDSIEQMTSDEPYIEPIKSARGTNAIPVVTPQTTKKPAPNVNQQKFTSSDGEWVFPGLNLIQETPPSAETTQDSPEILREKAEMLESVLADFKVEGEIVSIHPGPVVTLYELEPAPGVKSTRVISLADDIARSMSVISVRCAVVPGRNVIGIEMPNEVRQTVYMRDMLSSRTFEKSKAALPLILGKDIGGQPIMADLAKMPHLLVAGTTGSGKSVAVNTMIMSLLYRLPPEKCRFIMIDPKMLELSVYDDIPHLLSPVVTEPGKAVVALKWAVQEMEDRYRAMSKLGVRNIDGYNARVREAAQKGEDIMRKVQTGYDADSGKPVFEEQPMDLTELPYIVIIVDEFADLMLVAGKDVEAAIQRLAQMARAAGLHLIMATQRPSVDVITGVIKANFPTRISFSVTSKIDSRTILGEGGAEQLLGMGDMLYMPPGGQLTRVHGPFASDDDVQNVTDFLRAQAEPQYIGDVTDEEGSFDASDVMKAMFGERDNGEEKVDELYDQAVALVAREGKASTSFVQRYLQIGYNRAARIVEEMERQGVISPASKTGKREVLVRDFSDV
jgi:S-DNA-T family DNA segregation ATPase FtsK/SpoIIIE